MMGACRDMSPWSGSWSSRAREYFSGSAAIYQAHPRCRNRGNMRKARCGGATPIPLAPGAGPCAQGVQRRVQNFTFLGLLAKIFV